MMYTTENLEVGSGVAFDWFGGKVIFSVSELDSMISDLNVRKIYFNSDGLKIVRLK